MAWPALCLEKGEWGAKAMAWHGMRTTTFEFTTPILFDHL